MIVQYKFKVEYTVEKPICNLCKKDFVLDRNSTESKPYWDVEESFYVDGTKIELHKDCLKKIAEDNKMI